MAGSTDSIAGFLLYSAFFVVTTVFVIVAVVFWYMSPLGLGFRRWPADPAQSFLADLAYRLSYFIAMPAMVLGQVASAVLESRKRRMLACLVPSLAILFFAVNAGFVLLSLGKA